MRSVSYRLGIGVVAASVAISGCASVKPKPLVTADVVRQAHADLAAGFNAPPVEGGLSLEEAVARALKYNLDQRVAVAEQALTVRQYDLQKRDMLPSVMASAGYTARDEDRTRRSVDSVTGGPSLGHPFISEDREHWVDQLGVTWNLLDFGVGYYNAKQQGDRLLIAGERRRKAVHTLIQDVQTAFWRAYAAQTLRQRILDGVAMGEAALADSKKVDAEGLRPPLDSLRFQRQILENLRTLETLDQELSSAKLDLARLIDLPPSTDFVLQEPDLALADSLLATSPAQLEEIAIARNADLREQNYNVRIAQAETRKAMMRAFPRLSFSYGLNYDSDSYLIHNYWNEVGAQVGYSLMNLANMPLQKRLSAAGVTVAEQRRTAALMALVSQVHISRLQYANARAQFRRADQLSEVEERIGQTMSARQDAEVQGKLETISATTSYVITMLRRYQALAAVYAAQSRMMATLGFDPGLQNIDRMSLGELTQTVGSAMKDWPQQIAAPASLAAIPLRDGPASQTGAKPSDLILYATETPAKVAVEPRDRPRRALLARAAAWVSRVISAPPRTLFAALRSHHGKVAIAARAEPGA